MTDTSIADADVLAPEELREIAKRAVARRYPAKAMIVAEGDRSDSLFIILEGRARAFVSDEAGREVTLSVMGAGEYFGEVSLDDGPRSASVMTLEPSVLSIVQRREFDAFMKDNPAFASYFIRKLLRRIRLLTENVRSLALMDAYGRVARLLLESAVTEGGVQVVREKPTQAEIANRVGCSREMVSRIFKSIVQEGHVTVEAERIVIHDRPPWHG
jgi:CRP/FNR family cyclic AMP-dependent transcriptional regulator